MTENTCDCPEQSAPHPCPYREEMGDSGRFCSCCERCQQECAKDI